MDYGCTIDLIDLKQLPPNLQRNPYTASEICVRVGCSPSHGNAVVLVLLFLGLEGTAESDATQEYVERVWT